VGKKEREKFLSPLRDLITEADLFDLQEMINEGAAITLWSSNLKRFLERMEDQSCYMGKHQSSAELNLAITAFPTHPTQSEFQHKAERQWVVQVQLIQGTHNHLTWTMGTVGISVVLTITMWDKTGHEAAKRRELELMERDRFW
jgi:hypothetical protein